jgi:hypothetical protein
MARLGAYTGPLPTSQSRASGAPLEKLLHLGEEAGAFRMGCVR